jgi:2-dehydropantoate 2-reductase
MKALIYGGGAVGLGIASCLLKSKTQVDIIAREDTVSALRKHGLVRTGIWGDYSAEPAAFGSYTSLSEVKTKDYDYILVCTKSFDSFEAAKDLSKYDSLFGEGTKIVLFQNGWGNAEAFSSFFDKEKIYNARVITGFRRPKANEVTITVHADSIHIGSLFNEDLEGIEDLCESIAKGGIPCEATSNIEKDLWAKMLYNCALNPLGAILDVPYGVLAEKESARTIMKGIVEEVFDVMKAAGYETHWQSPKDFLEVFYEKLVPDTAEHKSSTLQDILAKKRTEIDALNGAVIRLAEKYGVRVTYNSVVYNIVKFIEAKGS